MNRPNQFVFESYNFDATSKRLDLCYSFDGKENFVDSYWFQFDYADYDESALDRAVQNLWLVAGVSYYKAHLPEKISYNTGQIDQKLADFLADTYQKGLAELKYVNKLDPSEPINFPVSTESPAQVTAKNDGLLIGLGGGKDSLVSAELLRDLPKVATWSLGHKQQLEPLVNTVGLPHFWVERKLDQKLFELNDAGAYNGHVPISAIFAAVGTVVCVLSGYRDHVVSNENSANEATLIHQGTDVNHQYSKSLEFEKSYQDILQHQFSDSVRYYSLLRPLSEVRIAELFSTHALSKYKGVFSSCNRAFRHDSDRMFWCGECPKCAFVFLALTPFVARDTLENIFGKNLLLDKSLVPMYRNLLGIEGDKPLECVGEIKESRAAMRLAEKIYPELQDIYTYDLPPNYDYRSLAPHSMPAEIFEHIAPTL